MAARRINEQQIQEVVKAYEQTGSIALAAKRSGVAETTASDCLVALGHHKRKKRIVAPEGMKYCGRCEHFLPEDEFWARGTKGKDAWCKSCNNARNRPHSLKHTLGRLGVTTAQHEHITQQQQGCCAICNAEDGHTSKTGYKARLSLDHNHTTGELRGLLCNRCNRGLGFFSDSAELLFKAMHYLLEAERKR